MNGTCETCCDFTQPSSCASFPNTDKSPSGSCYLWSGKERKTVIDLTSMFGIPELPDLVKFSDIQSRTNEAFAESVIPHTNSVNLVIPHPTWEIIDATKLEAYMECPRKFFYKHVLGWEPEFTSHDLIFGQAWHLAMEYLFLHGYGIEQIRSAHELFRNHYERYFPIEVQAELEPKSSAGALLALTYYCARYGGEDSLLKVLYTEIAGRITVLNGRILHFRMDTIVEDTQCGVSRIKSMEHKTTKSLERQFQQKWILHQQPNLYNHVLYCLFPPEDVYGVVINGTALYKQGPRTKKPPADFLRVPCRRTPDMMNAWINNLDRWLDDMDRDFDLLMRTPDSQDFMSAFKQNTTNCDKYWGCTFHDFCIGWANPVQYCADVPSGFVKRFWNPAEPEDMPAPKYEFVDGKLIRKEVN